MKIEFEKLVTSRPSISVFDGEKDVIINSEEYDLYRNKSKTVRVSEMCEDLSQLHIDGVENGITYVPELQAKVDAPDRTVGKNETFEEVVSLTLNPDKNYTLEFDKKCLASGSVIGQDGRSSALSNFIQKENKDKTVISKVIVKGDVEELPGCFFKDLRSNIDITLEEGIKKICIDAFYGYLSDKPIVLPESIDTLDTRAFKNCLSEVVLSKNIKTLGPECFSMASFASLDLPATITVIPSKAFYMCSSLESITLHEGLIEIGQKAFSESGLLSITLPQSLTTIRAEAFSNTSLSDTLEETPGITLPKSLTTIEKNIFKGDFINNIGYAGTMEEWKALCQKNSITSLKDFGILYGQAKVTCSDGELSSDFSPIA